MNEQAINDIKNALREVMQLLVQRGEPINDEVKTLLAQVMEHAATRIQELRQQPTSGVEAPIIPTTPQLEPGPFPSSNIGSFKYDPDNKQLYVRFHGKDVANAGPTYQYSNIPQYIFDIFQKGSIGPKTSGSNRFHRWIKNVTPSLGGTMNALIKAGGFPYQRIA